MSTNRILVCDDDKDILDMLELALSLNGFDVISVQDSTRVINTVHSVKPRLLLLDLWMPVMSGDEVIRQLRADDSTRDLPIIVISASQDGEDVATKAGADRYFEKPFDIRALVACLRSMLQHQST